MTAPPIQVCPFHTDEDVRGSATGEPGAYEYVCTRPGHPQPGPHAWISYPAPPGGPLSSGLAAELGLAVALPAALIPYKGKWVEYGVVEHAYAQAHPEDFAQLVATYGHRAVAPKDYTASAFLARALGDLSRAGVVQYRDGPSSGRWSYLGSVSWWSLPPSPPWEDRRSWASLGIGMGYVPGSTES